MEFWLEPDHVRMDLARCRDPPDCFELPASRAITVRGWVGLFASAIMAISAMTWMPYYPIWALTYVLLAVLAFYGLAAHGGRVPS